MMTFQHCSCTFTSLWLLSSVYNVMQVLEKKTAMRLSNVQVFWYYTGYFVSLGVRLRAVKG